MRDYLSESFRRLRSGAPFWSLRYHEERRESHAMRQETLEPPQLSDLQRLLRRLARHGDRVFIELGERLRHWVPVDSSVFNLVLVRNAA